MRPSASFKNTSIAGLGACAVFFCGCSGASEAGASENEGISETSTATGERDWSREIVELSAPDGTIYKTYATGVSSCSIEVTEPDGAFVLNFVENGGETVPSVLELVPSDPSFELEEGRTYMLAKSVSGESGPWNLVVDSATYRPGMAPDGRRSIRRWSAMVFANLADVAALALDEVEGGAGVQIVSVSLDPDTLNMALAEAEACITWVKAERARYGI